MSEKALAEVYEVRHMARTHHHTLCGAEGLATTCPHHVTCRACLAAYGPVRHADRRVSSDPDRAPDTLGACAIRELAELRQRVKELEGHYQDQATAFAGEEKLALVYRIMVDDLSDLLNPSPP